MYDFGAAAPGGHQGLRKEGALPGSKRTLLALLLPIGIFFEKNKVKSLLGSFFEKKLLIVFEIIPKGIPLGTLVFYSL